MTQVALGLRAHSGWAALVAVRGPRGVPTVVLRTRIELADARIPRPFQPYHAAAEMPFEKAEEFIRRTIEQTRRIAHSSLAKVIADLEAAGNKATACGIILGSGRRLGELRQVLAAHPLIHTAEGELFRGALVHAAARLGLAVTGIPERELMARAVRELKLVEEELRRRLADFKQDLGPPWQEDQKLGTLAAWLSLASLAR